MCRIESHLKKLIHLKYLILETPYIFFSIFRWYFIVLHTLNFLSPMFLGINNNFSFYEFSNLSFFVFVFTTLMKKISILNIFSTDLILLQINLGNTANLNSNLCRRGGGRYSQIFLGRGKNLIWGTWHFIGGLDNHLETMLYCYSCKFE